MIKIRRSVLRKILRRIPLIIISILILFLLKRFIAGIVEEIHYEYPYYYRADDVYHHLEDELIGRKIRVRGELNSYAPQTIETCDPPMEVDTRYSLRGIDFMECRVEQDECAMTCPFFMPVTLSYVDSYEIVGTLSYCPDGYLCLTNIEEVYYLESYSINLGIVEKVPITIEPVTFPIDEP